MKKILLIEDDDNIAQLEKDYLEVAGFKVDIEFSGKTGLERALCEDYDLIILDIMLPEIDGFKVLKKLRENTGIPIILVSARKEDIDKIRGLGLGADDYVTKPFSPGELTARVKSHIKRFERLTGKSDKRLEQPLEIRDLKIDIGSRRVFIKNREIVLTSKEFDILLLFARNPEHVFRKEDVFERIWKENSYGDITTVTVHIRKIREKIERDPSKPDFIETVWGIGYRFRI